MIKAMLARTNKKIARTSAIPRRIKIYLTCNNFNVQLRSGVGEYKDKNDKSAVEGLIS